MFDFVWRRQTQRFAGASLRVDLTGRVTTRIGPAGASILLTELTDYYFHSQPLFSFVVGSQAVEMKPNKPDWMPFHPEFFWYNAIASYFSLFLLHALLGNRFVFATASVSFVEVAIYLFFVVTDYTGVAIEKGHRRARVEALLQVGAGALVYGPIPLIVWWWLAH